MGFFEQNHNQQLDENVPIDLLLGVLGGYLSGTYPLNDNQMFLVKACLLHYAEQFSEGYFLTLENSNQVHEDSMEGVWAIVGKSDEGEAVVWHRPLPWPFKHAA